MPQFPLYAFVAVLLALLGAAFTGHLPPADLVRDLLLLALPGAGAVLRSLRPAGATAPAEVRILGGGQLLDLVALAQRLLAAEHPAVKEAGAQLGELLSLQPAAPAEPLPAVDIEAALETVFWRYDRERKQSGDERYTWKKYIRAAFDGQLGVAPTPPARSTPPSLPSAEQPALVDNRPPPTPIPGSGRLTRVPIMLLVPFLLLAQGCGAFGTALKDCAVSSIPATVTEGVGVALRKGAGWEQALADVVKQFGLCMVKTEVGAVAARTPPIAIASLEAASEGTVQEQEVAERARAWLRSHQ